MTSIIFVIVACIALLDGLIRSFAPGWQINLEKKYANASPQQKQKRLRAIRIGGAARLILSVVFLALVGISIFGRIKPQPDAKADDLEKMVVEHASKFINAGKSAAMTIAVISEREEKVITLGQATSETLFEIGSITKVFTGIALAREAEEGNVKLDDTAAGLLPTHVTLPQEGETITLRHLITHTSGFPRLPGSQGFFHPLNFAFFGGDPYAGVTLERFRESIRTVRLHSPPGKNMKYSNLGIGFLGWLLAERRTNSYENYIRAQVLEPLAMLDTCITLEGSAPSRLAQGYRSIKGIGPITIAFRSKPWNLANHLAAAGGLRSNGSDMLKFLRANMRPDAVPIAAALRRSHQALFNEGEYSAVGMAWMRSGKPDKIPDLLWHNGGTGGFSSFMGFFEDNSHGVVILSNSGESVDDLGLKLLSALAGRVSTK